MACTTVVVVVLVITVVDKLEFIVPIQTVSAITVGMATGETRWSILCTTGGWGNISLVAITVYTVKSGAVEMATSHCSALCSCRSNVAAVFMTMAVVVTLMIVIVSVIVIVSLNETYFRASVKADRQ